MLIRTRTPKSTSNTHFFTLLGCLIAGSILAPAALAADNPGAHEHGRAQLQMALENSQIDLMFTSPAYNLAGFEHEARTDEQKKQLADIRQWLETTPLINTAAGSCSVTAATVELGGESASKHGHDHHHDEDHRHDEKQGDQAAHRDYEIAQQLTCEGISTHDALISLLPARFSELEELSVEWVGPSGQGSIIISKPGQEFTLSP